MAMNSSWRILHESTDIYNVDEFRKMDLKEYLEIQSREIERHKWIESEKAGKDLGMDAVIDWILKYAAAFSDHLSQKEQES